MPTVVPGFLLKKLYVKGSFKNTSNGFQLTLRNALAPGTLTGFGPLEIDGSQVPLDTVYITIGDGTPVRASDLSVTSPRLFPLNAAVHFQVEGLSLAPGKHHVFLAVNTKEAGELKIDAEDTIT